MWPQEFFRSAELMLPGAIIGATFSPGFSDDLSTWRLVVDDQGNLFQDVESTHYLGTAKQEHMIERYCVDHRHYHVPLELEAVRRLLALAEEVGFRGLKEKYDASVTDMPSYRLSVRWDDREHTVKAYAADYMAYQGSTEMQSFMCLWEAVHEHAPFPKFEECGWV